MAIVAPPLGENQGKSKRSEKRQIERQRKKIEKKLQKAGKANDMKVRFDNETVTSNAPFTFLEAFKRVIGLDNIIRSHLSMEKHHNQQYSLPELLEQAVDALLIGHSRFSHMQQLKKDPRYP
jgi:hypothetical protein